MLYSLLKGEIPRKAGDRTSYNYIINLHLEQFFSYSAAGNQTIDTQDYKYDRFSEGANIFNGIPLVQNTLEVILSWGKTLTDVSDYILAINMKHLTSFDDTDTESKFYEFLLVLNSRFKETIIFNSDIRLLNLIQQNYIHQTQHDDNDEFDIALKNYEEVYSGSYCYKLINSCIEENKDENIQELMDKINNNALTNSVNKNINKTDLIKEREGNHSSLKSIKLEKYIDIKRLNEKSSISYHYIYYLAEKIYSSKKAEIENSILFFHNLNSSFIATLIANMLNIDFIYVDHLGPIYKRMNITNTKNVETDKKYIVVSDVICTGAELDRAISQIHSYNCSCDTAITVCDYGLLNHVDNLSVDILSIYNIEANANEGDFDIRTPFCKYCEEKRDKKNEK